MKFLSFLAQYISNPRSVGAVLPSTRYLADKMVKKIDFNQAKYILEYGPGTGVFTDKLLQHRNPKTIIVLFENNREFYKILKEKYQGVDNLYIYNGSAEKVDWYMKECGIPYVDYVLSGLPFATLPKAVSHKILLKTSKLLRKNGKFITFQYTKVKKNFIEQFFSNVDVSLEIRNVPPAMVLSCSLEENMEGTYAI
ncbi:SAM-dependent methyltransferase [Fictibacillus phosphorivorans]|uniref:SAM-dependent methyltransferase n=1 Tax=Fictibacillus phosphorivorans TaxID=1221500 RepID=A0A163PQW1_9BACL|nr:rRNA adenine N-6-methyltransferase family protein [Fictibacillus phosphorivorans]KZE63978.1 SAM-dependent methyltransferase [Fictibacillus phosphorivorans]